MAPSQRGQDAQNSTTQGPPSELPDPVPDFVSEIHTAIREFLANGGESLGAIIREIAASGVVPEAAAAVAF